MTVREAYEELGGDYEEMSYRISETMILKLLGMLLKDTNYSDICEGIAGHDYELAFRGAHTLKGVALNLGLTSLAETASDLTEALRDRQDNIKIGPALTGFNQSYKKMQAVFSQLFASTGGNM